MADWFSDGVPQATAAGDFKIPDIYSYEIKTIILYFCTARHSCVLCNGILFSCHGDGILIHARTFDLRRTEELA